MRRLILVAGLLACTPALAQQPPDGYASGPQQGRAAPVQGGWRLKFEAANTTHDGRLTREQAQAGGLAGIAYHFNQIDADHKGYLTLQDIKAFRRARRAQMAGQQQGQPTQPQQYQPQQNTAAAHRPAGRPAAALITAARAAANAGSHTPHTPKRPTPATPPAGPRCWAPTTSSARCTIPPPISASPA